MTTPDPHKKPLNQVLVHETRRFIYYTIFLTLLFTTFNIYERVLLGEFSSREMPYGYSIIEALILAKIIIIGQQMRLGQRFSTKPLIIPVLHKTILFCLLTLFLSFCEHIVRGVMHGKYINDIVQELISTRLNIAIARTIIMFYVFIFFFAVLETSQALGDHKLFNLFFKHRHHF